MKAEDKKDMMNIVCEALEEVVLPRLQKIEDDIKDVKDTQEFHGDQLDSIGRRLSAEVNRKDDLSVQIENHERRIKKLKHTA